MITFENHFRSETKISHLTYTLIYIHYTVSFSTEPHTSYLNSYKNFTQLILLLCIKIHEFLGNAEIKVLGNLFNSSLKTGLKMIQSQRGHFGLYFFLHATLSEIIQKHLAFALTSSLPNLFFPFWFFSTFLQTHMLLNVSLTAIPACPLLSLHFLSQKNPPVGWLMLRLLRLRFFSLFRGFSH